MNKDCVTCKYFISYQTIYEDNLEPHDYGKCNNDLNSDKDESFGCGFICILYELKI